MITPPLSKVLSPQLSILHPQLPGTLHKNNIVITNILPFTSFTGLKSPGGTDGNQDFSIPAPKKVWGDILLRIAVHNVMLDCVD